MFKRILILAALVFAAMAALTYWGPDFVVNALAQTEGQGDVTAPRQVFEAGHIQVTASSREGQDEYSALTAARYIALKRILETVQGLDLTGTSTIQNGMLASEIIETSVKGFVQGATECGNSYDRAKGVGTVCMRLGLTGQGGLYDTVYPVIQSEMNITTAPRYQGLGTSDGTAEAAEAVDILHDGLIVDVRAFPEFRPAMVNRILVDNDTVIFQPANVAGTVLVERGCGGYTNTLDKAKAQLEAWGSTNPLVIEAAGVQERSDVVISVFDADKAFSDNETTNMFANARVVYLLN